MIDLDELEKQREEASVDKVDLFDFYNKNWGILVSEITALRMKITNDKLRKKNTKESGVTLFEVIWAITAVISLLLVIAGIAVAFHFAAKYW